MLRFSLSTLLLIIGISLANLANAQLWEYIVTSTDGSAYYIDPLSIKREGRVVSYVQLTNAPKVTRTAGKSMLSFVQYKRNDCENSLMNISRLVGYENELAKGSIVTIEMMPETKWVKITPSKISDIIHQEVCSYHY